MSPDDPVRGFSRLEESSNGLDPAGKEHADRVLKRLTVVRRRQ